MVIILDRQEYKKIIRKYKPRKFNFDNLLIAFLSGGVVGLLSEALVRVYSLVPSISKGEAGNLMIVTFIFLASILTGLGIFDNLVDKFKAGLIIPITGFAHSTTSSAIEYKKEGLTTGIGANIFKLSGSVILYGIVSAYIFGIIRYIIFGG